MATLLDNHPSAPWATLPGHLPDQLKVGSPTLFVIVDNDGTSAGHCARVDPVGLPQAWFTVEFSVVGGDICERGGYISKGRPLLPGFVLAAPGIELGAQQPLRVKPPADSAPVRFQAGLDVVVNEGGYAEGLPVDHSRGPYAPGHPSDLPAEVRPGDGVRIAVESAVVDVGNPSLPIVAGDSCGGDREFLAGGQGQGGIDVVEGIDVWSQGHTRGIPAVIVAGILVGNGGIEAVIDHWPGAVLLLDGCLQGWDEQVAILGVPCLVGGGPEDDAGVVPVGPHPPLCPLDIVPDGFRSVAHVERRIQLNIGWRAWIPESRLLLKEHAGLVGSVGQGLRGDRTDVVAQDVEVGMSIGIHPGLGHVLTGLVVVKDQPIGIAGLVD